MRAQDQVSVSSWSCAVCSVNWRENVSSCTLLYCIVLYCIVLYCIVVYCSVLYCIVLYCKMIFLYTILSTILVSLV